MTDSNLHTVQTEVSSFKEDRIYTVSEFSIELKSVIEHSYKYIRIAGEASSVKQYPSGHLYFDLKDDNALLRVVCWNSIVTTLDYIPNEGDFVQISGSITVYKGRSQYQLTARKITPAGIGARLLELEKRKEKYKQLGYFNIDRKKSIPQYPQHIGVITSIKGAVIKDILHRIEDRFKTHVIVWGTPVQGSKAAGYIAKAIEGLNQYTPKPDIIIVARGGGSTEDLWAFNEDPVIQAIAKSTIPIISAIGHETDTTLADYVADLRAPTPTAAAEFVTPNAQSLLQDLQKEEIYLRTIIQQTVTHLHTTIDNKALQLNRITHTLRELLQHLDYTSDRLVIELKNTKATYTNRAQTQINAFLYAVPKQIQVYQSRIQQSELTLTHHIQHTLQQYTHALSLLEEKIKAYSYENTLKRGYVLLFNNNHQVIDTKKKLTSHPKFTIQLQDGTLKGKIDGT